MYCKDKFDKLDKIDNNNFKIDYRLLTTYPFIDFYWYLIILTNFYRFYQLLLIISFMDWTSQVTYLMIFWSYFSLPRTYEHSFYQSSLYIVRILYQVCFLYPPAFRGLQSVVSVLYWLLNICKFSEADSLGWDNMGVTFNIPHHVMQSLFQCLFQLVMLEVFWDSRVWKSVFQSKQFSNLKETWPQSPPKNKKCNIHLM